MKGTTPDAHAGRITSTIWTPSGPPLADVGLAPANSVTPARFCKEPPFQVGSGWISLLQPASRKARPFSEAARGSEPRSPATSNQPPPPESVLGTYSQVLVNLLNPCLLTPSNGSPVPASTNTPGVPRSIVPAIKAGIRSVSVHLTAAVLDCLGPGIFEVTPTSFVVCCCTNA